MIWILVAVSVALFFYYFLYKPQLYWREKNVKQGPPIPIFGDNLKIMFRLENTMEMVQSIYNRFKDERYCGMYQTILPTLMIRDLDLIKKLTVKDFDHFVDHRPLTSPEVDPLWGNNLFALKGESWKEMRATLSPAFTASKMRSMFVLMDQSAKQYVDFYLKKNQEIIEVELKESFTRFANDVIASCAFGLEIDSLKYPENEFYKHGRAATNLAGLRANLVFWLNTTSPKLAKALNLRMFAKDDTDFFKNTILETIDHREEKKISRPDVMNILMEARKGRLQYEESKELHDAGYATVEESHYGKSGHKKVEFTDIEVAAQLFVFFFGASDTISTMSSFLCFQLAICQDIQAKLRDEIDSTYETHKGQLSFDVLNKMKYLDMVVTENLRKYPPAPFLDRLCTKAYTIEPERPGEKPVHLKPGDNIWIPVFALQNDEKYYPNPDKFDPERFSDENKDNIIPYTFLPFGSGPRNCIGSRFALSETKILIFHILRRFELTVIKKTCVPLRFAKGQIVPAVEGGFWVGFKQREQQ